VTNRIKDAFGIDPKTGIQLLTPMHDDTLGTKNLNIEIQALLNAHEQEGLKRGVYTFKKNDNIMQIKNNYDKFVFNGDVGIIDRVSQDGVLAIFAEQEVFYTKKEMEEITLSYAITIHKSQGSEYPAVGSRALFERALQNEMSRKRNTCLKEKIFHAFNS
jgi:exodeoxyribonuclease V alpha subunit